MTGPGGLDLELKIYAATFAENLNIYILSIRTLFVFFFKSFQVATDCNGVGAGGHGGLPFFLQGNSPTACRGFFATPRQAAGAETKGPKATERGPDRGPPQRTKGSAALQKKGQPGVAVCWLYEVKIHHRKSGWCKTLRTKFTAHRLHICSTCGELRVKHCTNPGE